MSTSTAVTTPQPHNPELCDCESVEVTYIEDHYMVFREQVEPVEMTCTFGTCAACRQVLTTTLRREALEAYLAATPVPFAVGDVLYP